MRLVFLAADKSVCRRRGDDDRARLGGDGDDRADGVPLERMQEVRPRPMKAPPLPPSTFGSRSQYDLGCFTYCQEFCTPDSFNFISPLLLKEGHVTRTVN